MCLGTFVRIRLITKCRKSEVSSLAMHTPSLGEAKETGFQKLRKSWLSCRERQKPQPVSVLQWQGSGSFCLVALPWMATILKVMSWSRHTFSLYACILGLQKEQEVHIALQIASLWLELSHMVISSSKRVWKMQFLFQAIMYRLKMGEVSVTIEKGETDNGVAGILCIGCWQFWVT